MTRNYQAKLAYKPMKATSQNKKKPNKRRIISFISAFIVSAITMVALALPENESLLSPGPMNPGHEKLNCEECHLEAEGSSRQQIQANLQYLLGNRDNTVAVGHAAVSNDDCLACHRRPKDNHPVFRFNEPRFSKARKALAPQNCNSCHREHRGQRVSMEISSCKTCHKKLELKKEPLKISHKQLIKEKRWKTCLGCHDFHGNHKMKTETDLEEMLTSDQIEAYFNDSKSPYSDERKYKAKKSRYDEES